MSTYLDEFAQAMRHENNSDKKVIPYQSILLKYVQWHEATQDPLCSPGGVDPILLQGYRSLASHFILLDASGLVSSHISFAISNPVIGL